MDTAQSEDQKGLVIFDDGISIEALDSLNLQSVKSLDLLPLTGNWKVIRKVEAILKKRLGGRTALLNSALLLNEQLTNLRPRLQEWTNKLADVQIGKQTIKEWLLFGDKGMSAYWLMPLSERNPLKTDLFLLFAQVEMILAVNQKARYSHCMVSIDHPSLRTVIDSLGNNGHTCMMNLPSKRGAWTKKINETIRFRGFWGNVCKGMAVLMRTAVWGLIARWEFQGVERVPLTKQDLLFLTYFPYIDSGQAKQGKFQNRYAEALQLKLADLKIPVFWLLQFVFVDGWTFRKAAKQAAIFARRGERLYFLEEFLSLHIFWQTLISWVKQVLVYLKVSRSRKRLPQFFSAESLPLERELLLQSFVGAPAIQGALYYHLFSRLFRSLSEAPLCLYYCEMQAWEKALNAAVRKQAPAMTTIGYQHSSFSENYFHFFPKLSETTQNGQPTDLPLPNILACNGEIPCRMLKASGYKGLKRLEALRYLHVQEALQQDPPMRQGRPVLLIVGSYDRTETDMLLTMLAEAFPKADGVDIRLKGHPSCDMICALSDLGIDPHVAGYQVCQGDISHQLREAWAVLVATSTVGIEAQAYGSEVLLPLSGGTLCLAPISGFPDFYHPVTRPEDLRAYVQKLISCPETDNLERKRAFVREYWDLDPSIPKWTELIQSKVSSAHAA